MALAVGIFSFMPLQTRAEEPANEATGLQPVTNLGWSDTTPGRAVFYNPNEGNVKIGLKLYKDGNEIAGITTSSQFSGDMQLSCNFYIEESGSYTYVV